MSLQKKVEKINERNLFANTYFQKKCDLPNKSKLHIVQLHAVIFQLFYVKTILVLKINYTSSKNELYDVYFTVEFYTV